MCSVSKLQSKGAPLAFKPVDSQTGLLGRFICRLTFYFEVTASAIKDINFSLKK